MNILYIGGGFVGACSAAVSADSGHTVLVYDINQKKVEMLGSNDRDAIEACLYEKGLADLLIRNRERISFSASYEDVRIFMDTCDAVFMCLPTPEIGETGESNLTHYYAAAKMLAEAMAKRNNARQDKYVVVVNKSTVPIDMVYRTREIFLEHQVKHFGVVSNPEFLVEGKAIEGSMKPDRVVVGAESEQDFAIMRQMYARFVSPPDIAYLEVNPKEAAAGKLLANYYLFNRLAQCFDVVGRTCEAFEGVRFEQIRKILTSDDRIGSWGFYNSIYAGGSCFIKDARSLAHQLQVAGVNNDLVHQTHLANRRQLEHFLSRAETEADFDWEGRTVALLGLAFKRDTNDVRNSPSIDIVHMLKEKEVSKVQAYDPAAGDMFGQMFPDDTEIVYTSSVEDAMCDADVVIIATDWPAFSELYGKLIDIFRAGTLILDGRRMLAHRYDDLLDHGFRILAVGSPYYSSKHLNI